MGQKVNPKGFRLGIVRTWDSTWYADGDDYGRYVIEDVRVRKFLEKELNSAQVSHIEINRYVGRLIINCYVVRLGIAVGKGGARREELIKTIMKLAPSAKDIHLDFYEETKPDLAAEVVLNNIVAQIEKRVNFRRVLRQTLKRCLQSGAKGIKLMVAGRLNGAEMSRREWVRKGRIPLHTVRAQIDYACGMARTIYGSIGVKVWVYSGDIIPVRKKQEAS